MRLPKLILTPLLMSCVSLPVTQALAYTYLSVDLSVSPVAVAAGDSTSFDIAVKNSAHGGVATNAIVTISLPPDSTDLYSEHCTQSDELTLVCALPEISLGGTANVTAAATIHREGHNRVTASVNADDLSDGPEADYAIIAVVAQQPDLSPVNLEVELNTRDTDIYFYGVTYVTAVVRNTHDTNTALFPVIDLVLPESIGFESDDKCIGSGGAAICNVMALAPQSESETNFVLVGNSLDADASVIANVSSTQPDIQPQNNTTNVGFAVIQQPILSCGSSDPLCVGGPAPGNSGTQTPTEPSSANSEPASANAKDGSPGYGGGTLSLQLIFLLLLRLVFVAPCRRTARISDE